MLKKTILASAAVILTLYLFECGKDNGITGPTGIFQETHPITSIDTVNHIITLQRIEYRCEDSLVVADTMDVVYHYALRGNQLYIWKPGECGAGLFTGSGGSLYGTWVATDLDPVQIPEDVRPPLCGNSLRSTMFGNIVPAGGPPEVGDSLLINETVTTTITTTSVSIVYDGDFCLARAMADLYSLLLVEIVTRTCEYVVVRNTFDTTRTATLTSSVANQQTSLTFRYDSVMCMASQHFDLATQVPTCPDTATSSPMEAFSDCVNSSGFFSLQ
jgi:hypothetical protein